MKNYYKILTIAFVALLLAPSCKKLNQTPEFEASESFAAFKIASAKVDENKGQVIIPVQIASIAPVETKVSYKIVDGTAKVNENYKDTDESAVLSFDGKTREQNIIIDIINKAGEFTGDLDFSVELVAATGLKLSAESKCTVTIVDLDHPLAAILGEYEVSAYGHWEKELTYKMNLSKDPKDITVVWCDGILPMAAGNANYSPVYAVVTKDEETEKYTLTFPMGQVLAGDALTGDGDLALCELYYKAGYYIGDATTIEFKQTGDVVFETTTGIGAVSDSYVYRGGFLYGASTGDQYKTVWTKQ